MTTQQLLPKGIIAIAHHICSALAVCMIVHIMMTCIGKHVHVDCMVVMKSVYIRRHGSDVYLGMCPIKMAAPILMYYGASAKLAKRRRRRTIEGYG